MEINQSNAHRSHAIITRSSSYLVLQTQYNLSSSSIFPSSSSLLSTSILDSRASPPTPTPATTDTDLDRGSGAAAAFFALAETGKGDPFAAPPFVCDDGCRSAFFGGLAFAAGLARGFGWDFPFSFVLLDCFTYEESVSQSISQTEKARRTDL